MMERIRKICITNRKLLTGTAEFTPEVLRVFLERLELIAVQQLADAVILREKDLSGQQYSELAHAAYPICIENGIPLILHHFHRAALGFEPALPLHLSLQDFLMLRQQESAELSTGAALSFSTDDDACGRTEKSGSRLTVTGVSIHSVEEAITAERLGASYVTASHIFPTKCKPGLPPRGSEFLRDVCRSVSIPVYALGGIHPDNIDVCIRQGAAGVCMMSEYFSRSITMVK